MKTNLTNAMAAILLAALLAGCGNDREADDATAAADRTEPTWDVERSADEAADDMEQDVEAAGEAMEEAGDRVAEASEDAADRAGEMAADAAEETREMAEAAGNEAEEMADEAGEGTEAAMADASGAMSTNDDAASSGDSGDPCMVNVEAGDSIAFNVDSITVPSSCESVTVELVHTGSLPKEAMGHNWVLAPADALDEIGQAGMSAGADNNYLPDDDRIVAATDIIGGGESDSVTFSLDDLEDGVEYAYVCTFPGHWTVMRGPFNVE